MNRDKVKTSSEYSEKIENSSRNQVATLGVVGMEPSMNMRSFKDLKSGSTVAMPDNCAY